MSAFLQALVIGLGNGSTYALLAIGFVVIYKSTLVINFAQPALMVAGALMVSTFAVQQDWPFWVAVIVAALGTALIGLIAERLAMRPMVGKPVFAAAIVTLGLDVVIRAVENRLIGPFTRQVGDPWGISTVSVSGVPLQIRYFWMIGVTAVLVVLLLLFFKYSRIGLAMRATAFDQEVALAQGISVGTVFALSWAIAGALAAVAGVFVGTGQGFHQLSFITGFKALPAIILGGLDSVGGAIIGGLAVGLVEAFVATYQGDLPGQCCAWLGANFSLVAPYVLMLIVLLIKPYGLFGTPEIERV